jgi:hypothetical protein
MKKLATRNHPEYAGVERVDHDGKTHVVEPGDIEVSQKERLEWYSNGGAEDDEKILHKRKNIETSYDDGGNPMWTNESHRTSLPRPHQYSIERRLQEDREPGSTYDITSDASIENATAMAFTMLAPHVQAGTSVDNSKIVRISKTTGVPIQNVISLENIARKNPDLAKRYAGIPGVADDDDSPGLEKESEPGCECQKGKKCRCPKGQCKCKHEEVLAEEELKQIGTENDLC